MSDRGSSYISSNKSQILLNSSSICRDTDLATCRAHALLGNTSATVTFFFLACTALNNDDARASMLEPLIQQSVQNKVDFPLPRIITMAAWNKAN